MGSVNPTELQMSEKELRERAELFDNPFILSYRNEGLTRKGQKRHSNPLPYLKIYDLNNVNEQDIERCSPEKGAIEIGLKWTF